MAFEGPLEDRVAIHELVATYGDAVTRRSAAEWGAVWAEDGFWSLPEFPGMEKIEGRTAIVDIWKASMEDYPLNINRAALGAVNVTGDAASGRTYTSELVSGKDGKAYTVTGQYDDEYVKRDGKWLFKSRIFKSLHNG